MTINEERFCQIKEIEVSFFFLFNKHIWWLCIWLSPCIHSKQRHISFDKLCRLRWPGKGSWVVSCTSWSRAGNDEYLKIYCRDKNKLRQENVTCHLKKKTLNVHEGASVTVQCDIRENTRKLHNPCISMCRNNE